jgi:hypothetical protein
MSKAAESFMAANTLSFVVGLSVGKVTTVELRNESYVTGRVTEVTLNTFNLTHHIEE